MQPITVFHSVVVSPRQVTAVLFYFGAECFRGCLNTTKTAAGLTTSKLAGAYGGELSLPCSKSGRIDRLLAAIPTSYPLKCLSLTRPIPEQFDTRFKNRMFSLRLESSLRNRCRQNL